MPPRTPLNDEIARDDDQVWLQTVREGRADMQIGEHGNT